MKFNPDDYEAALVCGLRGADPFGDSMYGKCMCCGADIMWRPHSPHGPEIIKVCPGCGFQAIREMKEQGEEPEIVITEKSSEEFVEATKDLEGDSWMDNAVKKMK